MILIKSFWLALVDLFKILGNVPALLVVLLPLIVMRKYKNLKRVKV